MKHFVIKVLVAYDEAHPVPDDMEDQLKDNVQRCVAREELLNDVNRESVVDDWSVDVQRNHPRRR